MWCRCPGNVQRANVGDPQAELLPHDHESYLLQETSVHPPGSHAVAVGRGREAVPGSFCRRGYRQRGPQSPVRSSAASQSRCTLQYGCSCFMLVLGATGKWRRLRRGSWGDCGTPPTSTSTRPSMSIVKSLPPTCQIPWRYAGCLLLPCFRSRRDCHHALCHPSRWCIWPTAAPRPMTWPWCWRDSTQATSTSLLLGTIYLIEYRGLTGPTQSCRGDLNQFNILMMDSTLPEDRTMVAARRALVWSPITAINILLPAV